VRNVVEILKALADPNRVRALLAVQGRELCVCQLIELLGLAPSTVSKHMSTLRQARLVDARKDGRWVYYRAAGKDAPACALEAVQWLAEALRGAPEMRSDAKRLAAILRVDPEELCRRQCARASASGEPNPDCR